MAGKKVLLHGYWSIDTFWMIYDTPLNYYLPDKGASDMLQEILVFNSKPVLYEKNLISLRVDLRRVGPFRYSPCHLFQITIQSFFMKKGILSLSAVFFMHTLFAQSWSAGSGGSIYYNSGNVGIGTSSPAFLVDIFSPDNSIGTTKLRVANTASTGTNAPGSFPTIEVLGARGDGNNTFEGRLALGTRRTDGNALSTQTLGSVLFGGQYGTSTTFQTGNILYPASIQGIAEGSFTDASTMPTGIAFLTGSTGNDVGTVNLTYGTERMRISNSGNVGIGTSSPWSKLQVVGGSLTVIGADLNGTLIGGSQGGVAYIGNNTLTNGIAINSSGSVGIGTANTYTYSLAVNGSAIFTQAVVKLNNNWPDYVFQPGYRLPSLKSVEEYIRANNHLQGLPSADSVEKNGLDLGSTQAKLLEKIEELTLYTIELQKKVEKLETANKELEATDKKMEGIQEQIDALKGLLKK